MRYLFEALVLLRTCLTPACCLGRAAFRPLLDDLVTFERPEGRSTEAVCVSCASSFVSALRF